MFNSLEEAVNFGKQKNDGGVPVFRYEAVEIPNSDPPQYEDVVFVTIYNRGDSKTVIERPKRDEDEKRFPEHWQAFLNSEEAPLNGTPLKEFPALTPADIANCHRAHIRTVEDLATFPENEIKTLGGKGFQMKAAAQKFLEYRENEQPKVDGLMARIAELEKQIGDSTTDNPKRKPRGKSAKTKRGNGRRARPSGKGVSASKDGGDATSKA